MGEVIGFKATFHSKGIQTSTRRIRRGIAMPWCQSNTQWAMEIEIEKGPFLEAAVASDFKHTQTLDPTTSVNH